MSRRVVVVVVPFVFTFLLFFFGGGRGEVSSIFITISAVCSVP